jgi:hypothetical protein
VFPRDVGTPERDRHDLRSARDERIAHQFVRTEFARADKQPGRKFAIRDF